MEAHQGWLVLSRIVAPLEAQRLIMRHGIQTASGRIIMMTCAVRNSCKLPHICTTMHEVAPNGTYAWRHAGHSHNSRQPGWSPVWCSKHSLDAHRAITAPITASASAWRGKRAVRARSAEPGPFGTLNSAPLAQGPRLSSITPRAHPSGALSAPPGRAALPCARHPQPCHHLIAHPPRSHAQGPAAQWGPDLAQTTVRWERCIRRGRRFWGCTANARMGSTCRSIPISMPRLGPLQVAPLHAPHTLHDTAHPPGGKHPPMQHGPPPPGGGMERQPSPVPGQAADSLQDFPAAPAATDDTLFQCVGCWTRSCGAALEHGAGLPGQYSMHPICHAPARQAHAPHVDLGLHGRFPHPCPCRDILSPNAFLSPVAPGPADIVPGPPGAPAAPPLLRHPSLSVSGIVGELLRGTSEDLFLSGLM